MGFEEGQIELDSPTGAYYSGQDVNGRVVFELSKVKKVRGIFLKLKGFCSVHWTTEESRRVNDRTEHYTVSHDSSEEYFNLKTYVVGSKNAEHQLKPGKHEYPFTFKIPDNCPSSFEGKHGHVRYELKAVADRPFKVDQEIFQALRVIAPLDLNNEDCGDPVELEFDQSYCCWCMSSGSSQTLVKLPATGFCPGQTIPVEVSCNNTSNVEIDKIKFAIKEDITYEAKHEPGTKYEHDTLLEVRKGPVPGNTQRNWMVELELPDISVYNLQNCSFIDINYTFKVTIEVSGCHSDSDDSCDIIFGTVPLVGFQDNQIGKNETNQFPVPNNPLPQPVVNQPIASANHFQGANSPFPGPNQPYPPVSPYPAPANPYPSPNPPYPSPNPLSNNLPYPGSNPPYPNTSPYPGANPPYPNSTQVQGNALFPNTSPYPGANPPYPNSTQVQGNAPFPNTSPYPGANPPYPNSAQVQGNAPFPNTSPYPGANPPYPNSTPVQGNPPYPNTLQHSGANPPYPNTTPVQGNLPNPNGTPNPSPYPGSNPPYPIGAEQNPPHPGASPYPMNPSPMVGSGLKTGTLGFVGVPSPASVPLLPAGAGVPYPPIVTSPYATASAPEPGTPGSDQKKLEDDPNSSPFNPEFVNKN